MWIAVLEGVVCEEGAFIFEGVDDLGVCVSLAAVVVEDTGISEEGGIGMEAAIGVYPVASGDAVFFTQGMVVGPVGGCGMDESAPLFEGNEVGGEEGDGLIVSVFGEGVVEDGVGEVFVCEGLDDLRVLEVGGILEGLEALSGDGEFGVGVIGVGDDDIVCGVEEGDGV